MRGPTSFAKLRKVDDIDYPTFQAACRARHLLDDDQHWEDVKACISDSPHRLRQFVDISNLTSQQCQIFDRVCCNIEHSLEEMLFLDVPGGIGKTFVTKVILAQIRSQNKIALAVASSDIAATLLPGGKTAHTTFKIPIDFECTENPVGNVSCNSNNARVLRDCALIVWDECTMAIRKAVKAVDRKLRDIRQNERLMGGLTVLFCRDFRQTLPIIPKGTRADEIGTCLKSSILWRSVILNNLSFNMRAYLGGDTNAQVFSNLLLQIGNGTYPTQEGGKVTLVESLCFSVASQQELISSVYVDPSEISNHDAAWLCQRAILAPRNNQAAAINSQILVHVFGESRKYLSINTVLEDGDAIHYLVEFLDSLNTPGLSAHKMYL